MVIEKSKQSDGVVEKLSLQRLIACRSSIVHFSLLRYLLLVRDLGILAGGPNLAYALSQRNRNLICLKGQEILSRDGDSSNERREEPCPSGRRKRDKAIDGSLTAVSTRGSLLLLIASWDCRI
jgi:hypothetical protein